MDNKQGHAEAYKDVIHEDAIKIYGLTDAEIKIVQEGSAS
jgi:hypothetical protein